MNNIKQITTIYGNRWEAHLVFVFMSLLAFAGCSDPDGKWEPMKWVTTPSGLDKKDVVRVPADGDSYLFVCNNYNAFWISEICEDGEYMDLKSNNQLFDGDWYHVTISERQMLVVINSNETGKPRTLMVGLQSGDAFDTFTLVQDAMK